MCTSDYQQLDQAVRFLDRNVPHQPTLREIAASARCHGG
jgi:hypothetical protein